MVVPRTVFAHYMVGLCLNQTAEDWNIDITTAKSAAIDGFALNIGANDTYTVAALRGAYDAAAKLGNFSLFLSFDFAATGEWTVDHIANLTNTFKNEPAQFKVDGKPQVSTFEGASFADRWQEVRKKVDGDIFFVPNWSSQGPEGIKLAAKKIDGAFSFAAWPNAGETKVTTWTDKYYQAVLDRKAFMMGVSPYFYTRVPAFYKNWYSSSDSLWFDRWMQVLDVMPDMVQILTWNDFAESHYIADIRDKQVLAEAMPYVEGLPHAGFRAVLPYFIAAYKAGKKDIAIPSSMGEGAVVAWYRTTPANISHCGDGNTTWGQQGALSAKAAVNDVISIIAVSAKNTSLSVSLGNSTKTLPVQANSPQFFLVAFGDLNNETGSVSVTMENQTVVGPAITKECPGSRVLNFNAAALELVVFPNNATDSQTTANDTGTGGPSDGAASSQSPGRDRLTWVLIVLPSIWTMLAELQ
ncbi:glycoside hydrolase [Podospora didyma]|uniref:Glycoside hydrolase n=1 Tax=Podospora didyma TaxID=330526 RepID=A0AAE0N206_9PEZI|nr:glycoside hydrolase [Podospora didyma]